MIHIDGGNVNINGTRIDIYAELAALSNGLKIMGYSDSEVVYSIMMGLQDEDEKADEYGRKLVEAAYDKFLDTMKGDVLPQ